MIDFTVNDAEQAAYDSAERRGYEQLLRKLLKLPSRCAYRRWADPHLFRCLVNTSNLPRRANAAV